MEIVVQEIVSYWRSVCSKKPHSELIHTAVHKNIDFVEKNWPEFFGFGGNTHFYGRSAFSNTFFKNLAQRLKLALTINNFTCCFTFQTLGLVRQLPTKNNEARHSGAKLLVRPTKKEDGQPHLIVLSRQTQSLKHETTG